MESDKDILTFSCIMLAGGKGERTLLPYPKQFYKCENGLTLAEMVIQSYNSIDEVDKFYFVTDGANKRFVPTNNKKSMTLVESGNTRQESVWNALKNVDTDFVLIHDCARPIVSIRAVKDCVNKLKNGSVCVNTVFPPSATMVLLDDKKRMVQSIDRTRVVKGQCPQGFKKSLIRQAHKLANKDGIQNFSEDCSMMLHYFPDVEIDTVKGDYSGFKVTYQEDIKILEAILRSPHPSPLD